jgi:hypothetical protein
MITKINISELYFEESLFFYTFLPYYKMLSQISSLICTVSFKIINFRTFFLNLDWLGILFTRLIFL